MTPEFEALMRSQRPYASYFYFPTDRAGTEVDVVRDWMRVRYHGSSDCFVGIEHRQNPNDPPDVVLTGQDGRRIGIEVTEFVDGTTIKRQIRKPSTHFREYSEDEFRSLLCQQIADKCGRPFKGDACALKCLVIFSDEPAIRSADVVSFLSRFPSVAQSVFDEVWFMIPPPVRSDAADNRESLCRIFEIRKA